MICLMTPKCFIPVKRARPRNLEKDLVIIEKDREVLGHHQVMADGALKLIYVANSFTVSSNIC